MYNKFSAAFRSQKNSLLQVIKLMTEEKTNHIAMLYKLSFIKKPLTLSDGVM